MNKFTIFATAALALAASVETIHAQNTEAERFYVVKNGEVVYISNGRPDYVAFDKETIGSDTKYIAYHGTVGTPVDLGLSVMWASQNIGANTPYAAGDNFAWGETAPYYLSIINTKKKCIWDDGKSSGYAWSSYKYGSEADNLSKYNAKDNKTVLAPEDDAATHAWGEEWRTPTVSEIQELVTNCVWVWTNDYLYTGAAGYIVYKIRLDEESGEPVMTGDSYSIRSDTHIFLPACGTMNGKSYIQNNTWGYYWSSSVSGEDGGSLHFDFKDGELIDNTTIYNDRYYGRSIRAVYVPKEE